MLQVGMSQNLKHIENFGLSRIYQEKIENIMISTFENRFNTSKATTFEWVTDSKVLDPQVDNPSMKPVF